MPRYRRADTPPSGWQLGRILPFLSGTGFQYGRAMGRYARPSQVRQFASLQNPADYLFRHLNHTLLTLDGNFHANRYKKNSTPDDYSLFAGRAYFPKDADFRAYLRSLPAKDINDVCDCEGMNVANLSNFQNPLEN